MCKLAEFFRPDLISINITILGNNYMGKFLLIFLVLASANAFADVNKWVDDQGHVHYSDQAPPPEVQAKALRSASESDGTDTPDASDSLANQEAALKRGQLAKQTAAEKAAQKQAVADQLKANCDNAQKNLLSLQSGVRMMDIKPDGERYYLDDSERQQRINKAQQDISNFCK
jgi:hypothetical protein